VTTAGLSVNALFAAVPAGECTLNVTANGPGTVTVNPQQPYYDLGATVGLTAATTNAGTSFTGWSGDASGTASPLNLVLNSNKVVQANFVPGARPTLTIVGTNVLTWVGVYTLQVATNVIGPYRDVPGAASPYTNNASMPQQFFRLRE
jgi:hypothetical protein